MKALDVIDNRRERSTGEEQLLAFLDIARVHIDGIEEAFVKTHTLLENCQEADCLMWIESGSKLSLFLNNFDLHPFKKSGKARGYLIKVEWVQEWEARYR